MATTTTSSSSSIIGAGAGPESRIGSATSLLAQHTINIGSIDFKTRNDFSRLLKCEPIGESNFECRTLPAYSKMYRFQQMGMGFGDPKYPLWVTDLELASYKVFLHNAIVVQYQNTVPLKLFNMTNNNLIKLLKAELTTGTEEDKKFIKSILNAIVQEKEDIKSTFKVFPEFLKSIFDQKNDSKIQEMRSNKKIPDNYYIIIQLHNVSLPFNNKMYRNQKLVSVVKKYGFDGWIVEDNAVFEYNVDKDSMYAPEIVIAEPSNKVEAKIYRQSNVQRMRNLGAIGPNYKLSYIRNLRKSKGSNLRGMPLSEIPMSTIYDSAKLNLKQSYRSEKVNAIMEMMRVAIIKEYKRSGSVYPEYFGIFKTSDPDYKSLNIFYNEMKKLINMTIQLVLRDQKIQPELTSRANYKQIKQRYNQLSNAPFTPINISPPKLTPDEVMTILKNPAHYIKYIKETPLNADLDIDTDIPQKSILFSNDTFQKTPSTIASNTTENISEKRNTQVPIYSTKRNNINSMAIKSNINKMLRNSNRTQRNKYRSENPSEKYIQMLQKKLNNNSTPPNYTIPQKSIFINRDYQLQMPSNLNIITNPTITKSSKNQSNKRNKEVPIFSLQRQRKTRKNRK